MTLQEVQQRLSSSSNMSLNIFPSLRQSLTGVALQFILVVTKTVVFAGCKFRLRITFHNCT